MFPVWILKRMQKSTNNSSTWGHPRCGWWWSWCCLSCNVRLRSRGCSRKWTYGDTEEEVVSVNMGLHCKQLIQPFCKSWHTDLRDPGQGWLCYSYAKMPPPAAELGDRRRYTTLQYAHYIPSNGPWRTQTKKFQQAEPEGDGRWQYLSWVWIWLVRWRVQAALWYLA